MPQAPYVTNRATRAAADARGIVRYVWNHPANADRRSAALLRMLRYQARSRVLGRRSKARLGERSRLWVDLHRHSAAMALYANPPDLPEMLTWRRVLSAGGLFLDVGANVGIYTLWAAELGAEVIALEPALDTYELLAENIALNGYQVRAIQAAAGAARGTVRFTAGLDAANRVDPNGPVTTPVVTIDSLLGDRHAAGMKVDTEGFELEVLGGCAQALAGHRIGLIQLEWNAASQVVLGADRQPVASLLARYGYHLYRPDAAGRLRPADGSGYGGDIFATPVPPRELGA